MSGSTNTKKQQAGKHHLFHMAKLLKQTKNEAVDYLPLDNEKIPSGFNLVNSPFSGGCPKFTIVF
jgi:hypothetical protein